MLKPSAFYTRDWETNLSVYRAHLVTPRQVLALVLEDQRRKWESEDPKAHADAEAFFKLYGETVESLVDQGWRVARIAEAEFVSREFVPGPVDETGHQGIYGEFPKFRLWGKELAKAASLLPPEEYQA